jgi:GxxExxY protein
MAIHENDITGIVIDTAIAVHKSLGPGLLESVYEVVLTYELRKLGLKCDRQIAVPIVYNEILYD